MSIGFDKKKDLFGLTHNISFHGDIEELKIILELSLYTPS